MGRPNKPKEMAPRNRLFHKLICRKCGASNRWGAETCRRCGKSALRQKAYLWRGRDESSRGG